MSVPLKDLIQAPQLGLEVIAGVAEGVEIGWAHVSELEDPTPWLEGGEFLLTTGIQLFRSPSASRSYCERLKAKGVAALGISIGAVLPHRDIPADLVRAADIVGLPLVLIPLDTPLEAIVRAIASALEVQRTRRLNLAFEAQRLLTASALAPGGTAGPLVALTEACGTWGVVVDSRGVLLASTPNAAEGELSLLAPDIERVRLGRISSASLVERDRYVEVLPIGVRAVRGVLAVGKETPFDQFDRMLVRSAVSLLTIELERAFELHKPLRARRAQLVGLLMSETLTKSEARRKLGRVGLTATTAIAVVVRPDAAVDVPMTADGMIDLLSAEHVVMADERQGLIRALVLDPAPELVVVVEDRLVGASVGIGGQVPVHLAGVSLRQAVRALAVAELRGLPVATVDQIGSYRLIMELADPRVLTALEGSVLAPLIQADREAQKPALIETLREFLHSGGNVEATAAVLGIHRHTVRQRLQKIEERSNRRLASPSDRLELWIALEIRDLLQERQEPGGR